MKNSLILFNTACILLILFLSGCHTSRKATASRSRQPKFIDDVYINGHSKSNTAVSGSPHRRKAKDETVKTDNTDNTDTPPLPLKSESEPVLTKGEINAVRRKYAEILGVKPKEISNNALYAFIDEWYGVNYHLGGSDQSGIDCSAFTQKLYGTVYGLDLARTAAEQYSNCKRLRHSGDADEGDLVFFHVHSKHITHVGIYLMNDYFVHASSSQGVVISNLNDEYWHKYYAGIGRVKK